MNQPRRFRWWLLAICSLGLLLLAVWWYARGQGTLYPSWEEIGPIQVLGGPDEVWLFAEKEIRVHRGWCAEPTIIDVARTQEVIIITPSGVRKRIAIPGFKEPRFHPNISRIFRGENGFYLVQGQSMGEDRCIFRWQDDHFALLPLEESETLFRAYGLGSNMPPDFEPALDRMTESNGWKALYRDRSLFIKEDTFTWSDCRFQFKLEKDPSAARYLLRCTGRGEPWDVVLLEVATTRKEMTAKKYQELWNLPTPGHRKK